MKTASGAAVALVFCVAAVAGISRSTGRVAANDLSLKIRDGILYRGDRPYSGTVVERYLNGSLYRKTRYEDGMLDGFTEKYALNGRLTELDRYEMGKKDGVQKGWFAEGPKRFEYHFRDGILDGPQIEWHMNGKVFREEDFKSGIETGKKVLYPGGEIFTNYAKRAGRIYGMDGGTLCYEPAKREGEK